MLNTQVTVLLLTTIATFERHTKAFESTTCEPTSSDPIDTETTSYITTEAVPTTGSTDDTECSQESSLGTWIDEERFSSYQDAWKVLNQTSATIYYLAKSTYVMEGLTDNLTCWGVRSTKVYSGKSAKREFKVKEGRRVVLVVSSERGKTGFTGNTSVATATETHQAVSVYNYTKPNAVHYQFDSSGTMRTDSVIFSDGGTCNLFLEPHFNNGSGCGLWVRDDYIDDIPLCCSFIYDLLCSKRGVFDIYDKDKCKDVVTSLRRAAGKSL